MKQLIRIGGIAAGALWIAVAAVPAVASDVQLVLSVTPHVESGPGGAAEGAGAAGERTESRGAPAGSEVDVAIYARSASGVRAIQFGCRADSGWGFLGWRGPEGSPSRSILRGVGETRNILVAPGPARDRGLQHLGTLHLRSGKDGSAFRLAPSAFPGGLSVVSDDGAVARVARLEEAVVVAGRGTAGGSETVLAGVRGVFPNPARGVAKIAYSLSTAGRVRLGVYDVGGRLIHRLADGWQEPGPHELSWNGRDSGGRRVASGLYLYRFEAEGRVDCGRFLMLD